mmetsp:Transcript_97907/g.276984  ORF Transcript_97907/g.276984 Transcript_97907/m.276984 type:complete len:245 (+) Transcript_97907:67-801(+)
MRALVLCLAPFLVRTCHGLPCSGLACGATAPAVARGATTAEAARSVHRWGKLSSRRLRVTRRAEAEVIIRKTEASEADYDEEVCVLSFDKDGSLQEACKPILYSAESTNVPRADEDASGSSSVALVKWRAFPRLRDFIDKYGSIDPYKVLGLRFLAPKEQIRDAYMKVCKTEHPDLNGGVESLKWQMASEAYRILNEKGNKYAIARSAKVVGDVASGFFSVAFAVAAAGASFVSAATRKRDERT